MVYVHLRLHIIPLFNAILTPVNEHRTIAHHRLLPSGLLPMLGLPRVLIQNVRLGLRSPDQEASIEQTLIPSAAAYLESEIEMVRT